jgi:phosphatidylserine/phosphatidylglycerophosphate/cardiolipin synthase-like enzyme
VASGGASASTGAATGGTGGALPACDADIPRPTPPEAVIGPMGFGDRVVALIDGAETSIALMMYQLDCDGCVDALLAAQTRGVDVRVMVDGGQSVNAGDVTALTAGGVEVRESPATFEHFHAKLLLVDDREGLVTSANFNSYSLYSERNYGVVDRDPQDLDDLRAVFEHDWSGAPLDTDCTRLIISPLNARERILSHIASAESQLDLAVMYISDDEVRHAVIQKAQQGVAVRVLLADPGWIDGNVETAATLQSEGIAVRYLTAWELHAKLVVADGVALVGSQNMSWTSLEKNREVGLLISEPEPAAAIASQFEADWAAGVAP